jgi:mono/diheme cytochrome c family protein
MTEVRVAILILSAGFLWPAAPAAAAPPDYLKEVKPLLAKNCFQCHGLKAQKGGLRVDTLKAILAGGDSGPAVVPGKSGESPLIAAVSGAEGVTRMPLKKPPLPPPQIAILKAWIDAGATVPANDPPDDGKQGALHWAFVPPVRPNLPPLPDGRGSDRIHNPIDTFVLANLRAAGLDLAAEADRVTLLRRVSLDLTGLPPTPEEVSAFLADARPGAYERVVDRLLASPAYGERWARHWLDLARYADSNGYSIDAPREIWAFRDYVINALNRDLPFDQFTIEQIAGDMLPDATLDQKVATGFHRNTQINQEGGVDPEQFRVEAVSDRVSTTGTVWLGLTLGCCRCHDHKYDPVTQKEFYQLFAFLNNCDEPNLPIASANQAAEKERVTQRLAKLEDEIKAEEVRILEGIPEDDREKYRDYFVIHNLRPDQRSDEQKQTIFKFISGKDPKVRAKVMEHGRLKRSGPRFPTTMVLRERSTPRESYVHVRGDFTRKGETVTPAVPAVLHALPPVEKPTRLDLARWLVDPNNPLVARVTVNRIWQHYFGKGIVETENDFGVQGAPPTHLELLDWLACEFMSPTTDPTASAWSLKHIHRQIVTSATYRQTSAVKSPPADPTNKLLSRQNRLRLDAEVIRDCALTASGLLSRKIGGPSVRPPQPDGVFKFTQVKRDWQPDTGPDRYRRGLYTYFWRAAPHPALLVFDAPDAFATCTRRLRSNTPLQALTLLNDQAYVELAAGLASRLVREGTDDGERVRLAYRATLSREPATAEVERLTQYLAEQRREYAADEDAAKQFAAGVPGEPATAAAWVAVARVILNLDEFITRE